MTKRTKINKQVGKLLSTLSPISRQTVERVDIDKPKKGFAEMGRLFITEFVINKNYAWLQEMAKKWEETIINKK
jgi:hypothetical protein